MVSCHETRCQFATCFETTRIPEQRFVAFRFSFARLSFKTRTSLSHVSPQEQKAHTCAIFVRTMKLLWNFEKYVHIISYKLNKFSTKISSLSQPTQYGCGQKDRMKEKCSHNNSLIPKQLEFPLTIHQYFNLHRESYINIICPPLIYETLARRLENSSAY